MSTKSFLTALFVIVGASIAMADAAENGKKLAEQIRSAEPAEDSEVHGTLFVSGKNQKLERIEVVCKVKISGPSWETTYETDRDTLIVVHNINGPNQYFHGPGHVAQPPATTETNIPFAGSDFTLADLGLEFLHWPEQRELKSGMRLGRSCHVLESINPGDGEPARIESYIDEETGGLLVAESFDRAGRMIKEFSLHGSSFKKVNGQWRLQKMEIRNVKTGSQTILRFAIPKDQ